MPSLKERATWLLVSHSALITVRPAKERRDSESEQSKIRNPKFTPSYIGYWSAHTARPDVSAIVTG